MLKEIEKTNEYKKETEPEYTMAYGYPFWVIYKVIDYNGEPCLKEVTPVKKYLTNKILKKHIVNVNNKINDYTDIKQLPFIKEEFLSLLDTVMIYIFMVKELGVLLKYHSETIL